MTDTASKIANGTSSEREGRAPQAATAAADFDFRAVHEQVAALLEKQIFFVGGAEKSGTSWLQRLLNLHPQVSCDGESHFLDSLFPLIKKALEEHNQILLDKTKNPLLQGSEETHPIFEFGDLRYIVASAISMILLKQAHGKSPQAVGEKTPSNARAFGALAELFPGTKCIHIVRDPRDVGVSFWHHARRNVPVEARPHMVTKSDFVRQCAGVWTEVVGLGVRFGERHPDRYFELRYEDLVERTAPTLAGIFRFLGVDDSLAVAEGCARGASFEKLSGGRARGQENPGSFFRKGVVGDWRNHLDAETNDYVIATAGALMRRFGYL
jgi:Sulfotransferase domain